MDYARHASELGYKVSVVSSDTMDAESDLFRIPRLKDLIERETLEFLPLADYALDKTDLVLFSWPGDWKIVSRRVSPEADRSQIIHIVQGTHHSESWFASGAGLRLLARPMSRIAVTQEVADSIEKWTRPGSLTEVIPMGHDWQFFHSDRKRHRRGPLRVAYTTWKSDLGATLEERLHSNHHLTFRSIRGPASWSEIRELYQWSDVFLCTPYQLEGFFLPGLEAMASGAVVVTPDVVGNRSYCEFGVNCVEVGFEDVEGYEQALLSLISSNGEMEEIRAAAGKSLHQHSLDIERDNFGAFLSLVQDRLNWDLTRAPEMGSITRPG